MTSLANELYKHLRKTLRSKNSITYGELAKAVKSHHRSPALHAALTEITNTCRAHDLPSIPAIVWSSTTNRPGDGYYKVAHPRVRTDESRIAAWEKEHAAVIREATKFPAKL